MPTVIVEGDKSFEVPTGKKLVLGIEDAGIDILHRCGGFARCTSCRVAFLSGEPTEIGEAERATLEEKGLVGQFRLSCQIRVAEEDMDVIVPGRASAQGIPGRRSPTGLTLWQGVRRGDNRPRLRHPNVPVVKITLDDFLKENLMRIAATIARSLLGLIFTVFGLNGFLHFIPTRRPPRRWPVSSRACLEPLTIWCQCFSSRSRAACSSSPTAMCLWRSP